MIAIILHHYPQSPVAEKVRVVLGLKSLNWHSVEIPRLPPKPELMPLTGGYRRTPVMQIGADVYCDSQCFIRELERRFPKPRLFPDDNNRLNWGLSRWTDGMLFTVTIAVVLGTAQQLPADFAADRGKLCFGDKFDLETLQASVTANLVQLRAQLFWFDQQLSSGYEFLSQFEKLKEWEQRVRSIGHGSSEAKFALLFP